LGANKVIVAVAVVITPVSQWKGLSTLSVGLSIGDL